MLSISTYGNESQPQPLATSQLANRPKPAPMETPKHQIASRSASALASLVSADPLWGDEMIEDDDIELEVPDFHFDYDWDAEEKKKASLELGGGDAKAKATESGKGGVSSIALGRPSGPPRTYSGLSDHRPGNGQSSDTHTPPQGYGSGFSNHSSTSSARVASLTDASTTSASSMVPTPPSALRHLSRASLSSHGSGNGSGSGSGGSGDRPLGKTYGGSSSRTFQRHVSAPLNRNWPAKERNDLPGETEELSTSTATGNTYTATVRPTLIKTTSASSVHEEKERETKPSIRSSFITPGLTDRRLGPTTAIGSTTRRFASLSRFGGPARRVKPGEEEVVNEDERGSPVLMPSPPREVRPSSSTSPPETRRSPTAGPSNHTRSPDVKPNLVLEAESEAEPVPRFVHRRSPPMVRRHGKEPALPEVVEYLEPEQERRRSGSPTAIAINSRQDRPSQSQSQATKTIVGEPRPARHARHEIPEPQPPRPLETPHRPPDIAPPSNNIYHTTPPRQQYQSYAPAPAPVPLQSDVRQHTQTAPLPTAPEPSRHAAPPPPAPTATDSALSTQRKGFVVNGTYYERLGLLGKGGSSKVYSIMCPIKRTMLALKRVTLDRADHETYQSYTNEIELLKRLRGHDRIIQLVDHQITFSPNNRPKVLLMVMECGEIDFSMLLDEQRGKPLNFNFVGLYWQQMLQAVHAVHQENVVHTDLKPANFVLVKGRLKIIDFGIAKAIANDTVNIQRDQQIGTVNYMSPEAISKMTNLNVLKLSYPSDVWSLGCILYQMVYGSPPFAHIPGGPLTKMGYIADPNHRVEYPTTAVPRGATDAQGQPIDPASLAVRVMPAAIDSMRACLAYAKEKRLTIPKLLEHEFLQPKIENPSMPAGTTAISHTQMALMVHYVLANAGKEGDDMADDLYDQLVKQNEMNHL